MLHTDPLPQKPPPRWLEVAAAVLAALVDIAAGVLFALAYDFGVGVVFVLLLLAQGSSRNPSLEGVTLTLLLGAVLGLLIAISFAVKGHYWRAVGVVLGLIPLVWFTQYL